MLAARRNPGVFEKLFLRRKDFLFTLTVYPNEMTSYRKVTGKVDESSVPG